MTEEKKTKMIAELNDRLRATGSGGKLLMTRGIADLDHAVQTAIMRKVQEFDSFTEDNDPYGEHDFGSLEHDGMKIFWKIEYYDKNVEYGSEDPVDSKQTTRVLTIMLASEY